MTCTTLHSLSFPASPDISTQPKRHIFHPTDYIGDSFQGNYCRPLCKSSGTVIDIHRSFLESCGLNTSKQTRLKARKYWLYNEKRESCQPHFPNFLSQYHIHALPRPDNKAYLIKLESVAFTQMDFCLLQQTTNNTTGTSQLIKE